MIEVKHPLVYVEWIDAESDPEWGDAKSIEEWAEKECVIYDIGWMIARTKKYIVITNQFTHDSGFGNRTKIPRAWIKTIKKITLKVVRNLKV